ncbi:hypothetical protein LUZ60_013086 [Juncus effusus]|nr:hypothetical protein LUZ60_013086 [Juncus effusus]
MGRPPCCDKTNVKKGPWTAEEDAKLLAYTSTHGIGNWTAVPQKAGLKRCGKSCRLRYTNYLRPNLKHENFTPEEEDHIITLHAMIGSRWSIIANSLPGRTDNDVKNYWNTKLSKKLSQNGIDPVTHRPISDVMLSIHRLSHPNPLPLPSPSSSSSLSFNRELKNALLSKPTIAPIYNPTASNSFSSVIAPQAQVESSPLDQMTWTDFLVEPCDVSADVASLPLEVERKSGGFQGWCDYGVLFEGICSNFQGDHQGSSSFVDSILDRDKEMASEFPQLPVDDLFYFS